MVYKVTVVTLFPEVFPGVLGFSVVGRALLRSGGRAESAPGASQGDAARQALWSLDVVNIRDFGEGKHRTVDDTPYGGGAGMVMRADVVAAALRAAGGQVDRESGGQELGSQEPGTREKEGGVGRPHVVFLAPTGKRLVQADVRRLAAMEGGLVVLCGHYEGIDERVIEAEVDEVISVGDFVLSGGENAAFCLIDAVVRLLPGVLGGDASLHEESFDIVGEKGELLVEYPHYTRPAIWEGREVPAVLQGGNHKEIAAWRREMAKKRTLRLKD
ncbi:MAG: tRNA (guanosine(37)-N1)-methyltransferase TrmD [Proteobacteria bacterium]|nr:tRNA (guanosine(37)-N1)-methyltransferase TrmD [Pseudomonadota bacterium]